MKPIPVIARLDRKFDKLLISRLEGKRFCMHVRNPANAGNMPDCRC